MVRCGTGSCKAAAVPGGESAGKGWFMSVAPSSVLMAETLPMLMLASSSLSSSEGKGEVGGSEVVSAEAGRRDSCLPFTTTCGTAATITGVGGVSPLSSTPPLGLCEVAAAAEGSLSALFCGGGAVGGGSDPPRPSPFAPSPSSSLPALNKAQ